MTENYFYPDTHEMFELYDVLEALLLKKSANIGLFEGAEVSADPSLDFLIRILFTPVEDRCNRLIEIMKKTEPAKKIQNTGKYEEGKRLLKEYFGR